MSGPLVGIRSGPLVEVTIHWRPAREIEYSLYDTYFYFPIIFSEESWFDHSVVDEDQVRRFHEGTWKNNKGHRVVTDKKDNYLLNCNNINMK